jgi:hypothetical protein
MSAAMKPVVHVADLDLMSFGHGDKFGGLLARIGPPIGSGVYRFGDERLAAPRGGPDSAHQLTTIGEGDLKYLAISNMADPDVVEYPDSDKFAISSAVAKPRLIIGGE